MTFTLTFVLFFLALIRQSHPASYFIFADGGNPRDLSVSSNTGQSWLSQKTVKDFEIQSISCVSDTVCLAGAVSSYRKFQVLLTEDGGKTWRAIKSSEFPGEKKGVMQGSSGLYCIDRSTCLFGYANVIIRTTDGFNTQQTVLTVPNNEKGKETDINDIECIRNGTICLAVGDVYYSGKIYRSTDSGKTWSLTHVGSSEMRDISCVSTPNGRSFCMAAGGQNSIMTSVNDGKTWQALSKKFESTRYFSPSCPWPSRTCSMATKIDSVSCLKPWHCALTYRGYRTGSDYTNRRIQNGAMCSVIKYQGKQATVKCTPLSRDNVRTAVHCSSPAACLAVSTTRYERRNGIYKYFEYKATIYRLNPESRTWSSMNTNTGIKDFGSSNQIFGTSFIYNSNSDFISGGGGVPSSTGGSPDSKGTGNKDGTGSGAVVYSCRIGLSILMNLILFYLLVMH